MRNMPLERCEKISTLKPALSLPTVHDAGLTSALPAKAGFWLRNCLSTHKKKLGVLLEIELACSNSEIDTGAGDGGTQLHVFCDVSEAGYGAVV